MSASSLKKTCTNWNETKLCKKDTPWIGNGWFYCKYLETYQTDTSDNTRKSLEERLAKFCHFSVEK